MEETVMVKCDPDQNPWEVKQFPEDFARVSIPAIEAAENMPFLHLPKNHNNIDIKAEPTTEETSDEIVDADDYYTKEEVDELPNGSDIAIEAAENIPLYLPQNHNDISIKTEPTTEEISDKIVLADYYIKEEQDEIPNGSDYVNFDPLTGISGELPDHQNKKKVRKSVNVQCNQCTKTFKSVQSLNVHMTTGHSDERPFACDQCEFRAKRSHILQRHIERIHLKLANHQCNHCGRKFFSAYALKLHVEKLHAALQEEMSEIPNNNFDPLSGLSSNMIVRDDVFINTSELTDHTPQKKKSRKSVDVQCNQCTKIFKSVQSLNVHMTTAHSDERPFACDQCEFRAKRSRILQRHIERIHMKLANHKCIHCGRQFYDSSELKLHVDKLHSTTALENSIIQLCDMCDCTFDSLKGLRLHRRIHKIPTEKPTFNCDQCDKVVTTKFYLNNHMKKEHPTDEQIATVGCICETCNMSYQNSMELNCHLDTCHQDYLNTNFKCDDCEINNWHSHISLRKHYAEAHRKIWDICKICGLVLKVDGSLYRHMQAVHNGVKDFTCKQCGKEFGKRFSLQYHISSIHEKNISDKYRFKCDQCDYITMAEYKLKEHINSVHIREVKYECDQCDYFGYRKDGLKNHIKAVHKKLERHKCEFCEMGFYHRRDKIKHIEKHHVASI
jgi:KRAB domain-containing zinc finger protein